MRWTANVHVKAEWHRWFAWYPVKIGHEYVWLETVHRKRVGSPTGYGYWDYAYQVEGQM